MATPLWFRLEEVLPVAEHALASPSHRITGAQARALGPTGAALTLIRTATSDLLQSNGAPVWYDATGQEVTAPSYTWRHATAGTRDTPAPRLGSAYLPLQHRVRDQRPLIDVLRAGRNLDRNWVVIDPGTSTDALLGSDAVRVLDHRDDLVPSGTRWRPRMVTSPRMGDLGYPALVAEGYTTNLDGLIVRFDPATARRIAADLDEGWRRDSMPGEYPRLRFDGDTLVLLEEYDTGAHIRLDVLDYCYPDRDGYYSIGAYLWFWYDNEITRMPTGTRMRLGLTALMAHARQLIVPTATDPSMSQ